MANDTETWKDKDVNFRVPEESEQVLVKNGVPSTDRVKENSLEVTVH